MPISQQIAQMVDMLPNADQELALEMVKKLVLAWDPDFSRLTPAEAAEVKKAEKELASGEAVTHDAINWD